jgi:1-acyl-sn-glycerol-3-phosphate acyltransferase
MQGRRTVPLPHRRLPYVSRLRSGLPVAPVATNLGCFWPQMDLIKNAGRATVEFLDPIPVGLSRGEFLRRLEDAIETRSQELICSARGEPFRPSVKVPAPDELERAAARAATA